MTSAPKKATVTAPEKTGLDALPAAPLEELPWAELTPATLARAKTERKYVVLDGSAEWCHFCHVMENVTYHDPAVRKLLESRFIAVKVDIDSRPDIQERYADYGWPATVIFSPDAAELGKYRGYIPPDQFVEILKEVVASGVAERGAMTSAVERAKAPKTPLSEEHLLWIQHATDVELDDYWDEEQGGWGKMQKAPLGVNNAWLLWRAAQGDAEAKKKASFVLDKQSKLIDPVWGGIYQYSAASDWDHAHFEKLMTFQAPALENYAAAYRLTRDEKDLRRARAIQSYVDRFMRSPEGGFYTTQDADVNAHDRGKAFMTGHDYYALGEKDRLARGLPRVDTHEYGRENGLAIAAYVTMFEVTKDAEVLATAEKAARRVIATHASERGGITHDVVDPAKKPKQLFLSDNAAFGFGLVRLWETTKNDEYLRRARAIADFMIADLLDDPSGAMFASTADPDAVGIFATRRTPFEDNVMAIRMLARLARATNDAKYKHAIDRVLRAVSTPEEIKSRGRWLGDYLLALEESKGVRGVK